MLQKRAVVPLLRYLTLQKILDVFKRRKAQSKYLYIFWLFPEGYYFQIISIYWAQFSSFCVSEQEASYCLLLCQNQVRAQSYCFFLIRYVPLELNLSISAPSLFIPTISVFSRTRAYLGHCHYVGLSLKLHVNFQHAYEICHDIMDVSMHV